MLREILQPRLANLENQSLSGFLRLFTIKIVCLMAYGFSIGCWRSWEMGLFVAIKTPLLILSTLATNSLLNGLFGVLIGGLRLRESLRYMMSAFASSSLILVSLIPVVLFFTMLLPNSRSDDANWSHSIVLFQHVLLIAMAGVATTCALDQILCERCQNRTIARLTLLAWLAGNAVLGAQFSWIFRPFFGSPTLKVQFLRENPMRGNFYESVWKSIWKITGNQEAAISLLLVSFALLMLILVFAIHVSKPTQQSL